VLGAASPSWNIMRVVPCHGVAEDATSRRHVLQHHRDVARSNAPAQTSLAVVMNFAYYTNCLLQARSACCFTAIHPYRHDG
jgi:hypothetical protein